MLIPHYIQIALVFLIGFIVALLIVYFFLKGKVGSNSKKGVIAMITLTIGFTLSYFFSYVHVLEDKALTKYSYIGTKEFDFGNSEKVTIELGIGEKALVNNTANTMILQEIWYQPESFQTAIGIEIPPYSCVSTHPWEVIYDEEPKERTYEESYEKKYWLRTVAEFRVDYPETRLIDPVLFTP